MTYIPIVDTQRNKILRYLFFGILVILIILIIIASLYSMEY